MRTAKMIPELCGYKPLILQRVERHVVKKNDPNYEAIDHLCFMSKNLYNYTNYLLRQSFFNNRVLPKEFDIVKEFHDTHNYDYYNMCGNTNQQCIKLLYKNWKSFFKATKEYNKDPSKFLGKPKMPKYKDKKKGRNVVIFTYSDSRIKDGYLYVNGKSGIGRIKTNVVKEQYKQTRIVPQCGCYIIEVIYEIEQEPLELNPKNYLSIDLGVNNLATCYDNHDNISFIINGRIVKSINQYYNKKKAVLMSYVGDRGTSNRIQKLTTDRNNKINNYMHNASRMIIDYCVYHNIGTIVIGHNDGWKQEVKTGKKNNQNFVSIPFNKLISQIQYKAENVGITCIVVEESYTSKVDHLALEEMCHHDKYIGKRKKRGLFKSSTGRAFNADLNGAVGILRKVIDESQFIEIVNRGFVTNPFRVNPLIKIW